MFGLKTLKNSLYVIFIILFSLALIACFGNGGGNGDGDGDGENPPQTFTTSRLFPLTSSAVTTCPLHPTLAIGLGTRDLAPCARRYSARCQS